MKTKINNLKEMINSKEYQVYESETLLDIQYHIINTDKDINEMITANHNGNYGCSHQEFIDTWKEFLNTLLVYNPEYNEPEEINDYDITQYTYDTILNEINEREQYHINAGTINQII